MEDLGSENLRDKYWKGWKNSLCRYWFYVRQGNGVVNEFRNLFLIILGTCWTFKQDFPILRDPLFLAFVFLVSFVGLFVVGYFFTHKVNRVIDWLSIEFSTHWGRYSYTLQEDQNRLLREILTELKGEVKDEQ